MCQKRLKGPKGYKAGQYQETSHYNKEMLFHTQEIVRRLDYEDEQTGTCAADEGAREASVLKISWLCFISGTEDGRSQDPDYTVKVAVGDQSINITEKARAPLACQMCRILDSSRKCW